MTLLPHTLRQSVTDKKGKAMKENYEEPEMEIVIFETSDIITASVTREDDEIEWDENW